MGTNWYLEVGGDILFFCKAIPGSRKQNNTIQFTEIKPQVKGFRIYVRAEPVDGKANKEIISTLSDELGIKESRISIKSGTTYSLKHIQVQLDGDMEEVRDRLNELAISYEVDVSSDS